MKRYAFSAALALLFTACGAASQPQEKLLPPVEYVTTLMGTQSDYAFSTGNTYPAIALPWGMNFWTPQTGKMGDGWTYTYGAHTIRGYRARAGSRTRPRRPNPTTIRSIWPTTTSVPRLRRRIGLPSCALPSPSRPRAGW